MAEHWGTKRDAAGGDRRWKGGLMFNWGDPVKRKKSQKNPTRGDQKEQWKE